MATGLVLGGAMVALATPVRTDGDLDPGGLERLVTRVVAGGVAGVSPVGSTGEGPRLTRDQRLEVTRRVRALVPAGMPVLPGVPATTVRDGLAELEALADVGAAAALVSPPSYYPLSDDAVQRLYETLAARSPLPLLLYNIPNFTKVRIAPQVVAKLAAHPNIVGIKDSSRDMEYQQQVILAAAGAEFTVLTGTDSLLVASLMLGAAGTIAASANLVPELTVGICRAVAAGDLSTAVQSQRRLARVVAACRASEFPAGWKAALEIAGVCGAHLVPPASPLAAADRARLRAVLTAESIVD